MARGRMIAKSLSTSQKYARLHEVAGRKAEFCQALYPLLVAHADDFGRLAGDVFTVKHAVVPASSRKFPEIQEALESLAKVGLIAWYFLDAEQHASRKCIQIIDFDKYQGGLHKRTQSIFPEVPDDSRKFPEIPSELKGRELKGREVQAAAAPLPVEKAVENPEQNVEIITALILKEVIPLLGVHADPVDIKETTKERCAHLRIAYDGDVVCKAMDSAEVRSRLRKRA